MKTIVLGALWMGVAFADAVTDWNTILRSTIAAENGPAQSRYAAITHLAMFEAVNAITKDYQPYLRTIQAPDTASPDAAAIAAAHVVLRNYFSARAADLDAQRAQSLGRIPDGPEKNAGIAAGESAAMAMIAQRANDGAATPVQYAPMTGIGYWQPTFPTFATAALLNWGRLTPFGIARPDQFRPKPPPSLTSQRYTRDYNEVADVGDVLSTETERPQDRINVARYAAMVSPTELWNGVTAQLSAAGKLSLAENARLFALVNMAVADAAIAVFEAKYFYHLWRPVTAIRMGELDGNPRTPNRSSFTPFITTPPYPSYPSGYGGLSNAARSMLERIFGRGRHAITVSTPALPGVTFRYTNLRHITDDVADARIYAGIHFRFDQEEAETLAERIAGHILRNHLKCARRGGCGGDDEE